MGGSSVPSSTYQQQNLVTGLWAVPELKKRALKLLDPALQYTGEQQAMMIGVNKADPAAMRKALGLPATAPTSDITAAMARYGAPTVAAQPAQAPLPIKSAAQGGVMGLFDERRRYAEGGTTKALSQTQQATVQKINKAIANGTVTQAQIDKLNKIEANTNKNVSPYSSAGTSEVQNKTTAAAISKGLEGYNATPAGKDAAAASEEIRDELNRQGLNTYGSLVNTAGYQGVSQVVDPKTGQPTGQWQVTDPTMLQLESNLKQMQTMPSQFGQATDLFNQASQGLAGLAGYSPQQVAAQNAAAQQGAAQQAAASTINRGAIRDVNAQRADVSQYNAALMQAPEAARVQDYEAAIAQANQMARPEDVSAERMAVSQMTKPEDVQSKALEYFQMQGPGSWTDEGVSQKYMSPYMQGVIDIAKREKGRDYAKQLTALNAQAASAGAFGGGRQAMERSQAARDYQQQLQDLETQGLQQAYQQGMSQYGAESALGQQANIQNLQALLGVQSQEAQQALQAALANQAAGLTTEQQNLASRNLAGQTNQQAALQAALANQQAGLTTGQANLNAAQQTALANQQAINNQRQQYVQNALQAEMQRYGGQLTAAQQNQVAQNAAAQFNASSQNQANNNYVQQQLTAMLQNQGMDYQTAAQNAQLLTQTANQNAQLGTQASLQNASLGTQANLANAQNALQAGMANQAAGLQANQQGIGAFGAMGNMAQGLAGIGVQQGNYGFGLNEQLGKYASGKLGLLHGAAERQFENAGRIVNAPIVEAGKGLGAMQGLGGGQGGTAIQQTNTGR